MAQDGFMSQWGLSGRDDLGIMSRMGANYIRLYHPVGVPITPDPLAKDYSGPQPDHTNFLDAAKANDLQVFGAVHQYIPCPDDDCFGNWAGAVHEGLNKGFAQNGSWHSAVWAVNMINEVDAIVNFEAAEKQVKRIISSVDGLLYAEKMFGVNGTVNLTSCFTTALATPLGGGAATIYHGFSSVEAWIKNTSLVDYTPRSVGSSQDLAEEIDRRWIHCMNAQMPWKNGLDGMVANQYEQFMPRPWIVGEMGWNGGHHDAIEQEVQMMNNFSKQEKGFLGSFVFQFQTAYEKTGSELNFGLFGLGEKDLDITADVGGKSYPVQCLTSKLYAFEQNSSACKSDCDHRAQAVAKAFGGKLLGDGLCLDATPVAPSTQAKAFVV
jgi:hypothetical protein